MLTTTSPLVILATLLTFLIATPTHADDPYHKHILDFIKESVKPVEASPCNGDDEIECGKTLRAGQCGMRDQDKVDVLPGQPDDCDDFLQYAGYVMVETNPGRALFYYFTPVAEDDGTKPLLFWFSGGGYWEAHSSLGQGALMGQGPFRVNSDGETLKENKYAWNKVANTIFVESPVGVGFSYSNDTADYDKFGDKKAVIDAFTFITNWIERFPMHQDRDVYIAGDGYAGHCVPQLAHRIIVNNYKCNQDYVNLKGIIVGNGWMDEEIFLKGTYDYAWMHDLISVEVHDGITTNCDFSYPFTLSPSCLDFMHKAAEMVSDINPYDNHGPSCKSSPSNISVGGYDSCLHSYVETYLNLPTVQNAIHANVTSLPYAWTVNSTVIKGWRNWYPTITPIIEHVIRNGTRVWLYSGDTDSVVPITSTMYFIDSLELPVKNYSYSWYSEGKVAGLATAYENLTFVTVRDGGHFVSSYQPGRALTLFSSFIQGTLPPDSPN